MNEKEKEKLNNLYKSLKAIQTNSGDSAETYTTGYRNGHLNGQISLLEDILGIDVVSRSEIEQLGRPRFRK